MNNGNEDRFKRVDNAIDHVRKEFDEVINESREAGGEVREDVRETIDDVEARPTNSQNAPKSNTPSTSL